MKLHMRKIVFSMMISCGIFNEHIFFLVSFRRRCGCVGLEWVRSVYFCGFFAFMVAVLNLFDLFGDCVHCVHCDFVA